MKRSVLCLASLLVGSIFSPLHAADAELKSGDYVAIIGDSITEQKMYSVLIEDYLLMCKPRGVADLRATQFGWGGETAPGFAGRMQNDMTRFGCNVATTCFGMNDGGYSPMDPGKADRYRTGQKSIVDQLKKANVRLIVVGSPGCVDADTFHNDPAAATMYNKTLSEERDIAKQIAESEGCVFANVFDPMVDAMTKAKVKYGKAYHVAGGDGVHPDWNGHLIMAYAYIKALGADGQIGTITVDLAGNAAQATDGHKVLSAKDGSVEVESSKYPFCFVGDPKTPGSTRGILEFLPFNQELNRFMLVVKNIPADKAKITWGTASKEFSKADLEKGINLADEFLDNPFSEPFAKMQNVIRQQQEFETPLVKSLIHNAPDYMRIVPEEKDAMERILAGAIKRDKELVDASVKAVVPVKHTIKIEAIK